MIHESDVTYKTKPETETASLLVFIFFFILIIIIVGESTSPQEIIQKKELNIQAEINGYVQDADTLLETVTVLIDYNDPNKGFACRAKHGEKVVILDKIGTKTPYGVKIRTASGITGWVSNWFVKEQK